MRLGFDGHVLTGKFQGTRTTLGNLLKSLARIPSQHDIVVFTNDPAEARANLAASGTSADHLFFEPLTTHAPLKRLLMEIPRRFKASRIDCGVFNYIAPPTGRSIVFIHDILPMTHKDLFPLRFRLRSRVMFLVSAWRARRVISVSHYTSKTMLAYYGPWLAPKLRTIPNGPSFAESTYFAPRTPDSQRYILCVGRIEQRKNVDLLVNAFLKADLPDVDLVVVGASDHSFDYAIPADPRVRQICGIDEGALIELFRGASLFVYPSQAEGFGLPLLDAVLFGIPTISSNCTAMPEVGGDLVEYFDPTSAGAIDWLARRIAGHFGDNPVVAPDDARRRTHASTYSWDRAAHQFLSIVRELG